ncbi:cell division cycle 20.5, cofactor of APC complex-like [Wolffia australiana]
MDWSSTNIIALALGRNLYLWNAGDGQVEEMLTTESEERQPTSVSWSADGTRLAVGFADSTVQIWDLTVHRKVRVLTGHTERVNSLSWNSSLLSSGSRDSYIINHDVRTRSSSGCGIKGHASDVCGLRWSEGGNLLASGGNDSRVFVWEARSMRSSKHLYRFSGHSAAVRALAWSPHQHNLLASGGGTADGSIKFWNTRCGKCCHSIDTGSQVCALEWNKHRDEFLSAHGFTRNQLSLWSYPSMRKIGEMNGHSNRVLHLSQVSLSLPTNL